MSADGALDKKIAAYTTVMQYWADAFGRYQGAMVPTYMMGGNGSAGNAGTNFMQLMSMQAMKDLNLNLNNK